MNVRPLTKELQEKAIVELNAVPNRLKNDIDHILQWLKKQPHLKARTEEQWILNFLRTCKFSLQKTKEKIDSYYTLRTIFPWYFTERNPFYPSFQLNRKLNMVLMLRQDLNALSPVRFMVITRNGDPDGAPAKDAMKCGLMIGDILLYKNDTFVINGIEVIFDVKCMPYGYIGQCTPSFLWFVATMVQSAYPLRVKGIYVINISSIVLPVVKAFISLLSAEFRERIHIYAEDGTNSLYKSIPQAVLPNEYGGNGGTLSELSDQALRIVEDSKEWFEEDAKYGTDESKRPEKSKYFNLQLEGSFRKLDID